MEDIPCLSPYGNRVAGDYVARVAVDYKLALSPSTYGSLIKRAVVEGKTYMTSKEFAAELEQEATEERENVLPEDDEDAEKDNEELDRHAQLYGEN